MTVTPVTRDASVTQPLPQQINEAYQFAREHAECAVEWATKCGQLLLQAQESVDHGEWLPWLAANVPGISVRTAQGYMRLARHYLTDPANTQRVAHLSLRAALAELRAETAGSNR